MGSQGTFRNTKAKCKCHNTLSPDPGLQPIAASSSRHSLGLQSLVEELGLLKSSGKACRISEMPVTSRTKQVSPIYVKLPENRMVNFTLDFFLNPIT